LRFISDSVSDMSNVRSMLSRQASDAVDTTADGHGSDSGPDDFFENASPDTKSEVSQYYDAESEGMSYELGFRCALLPATSMTCSSCVCSPWQQQGFPSRPD